MARLASQMLGGYFPTPPKTLAILTAAFKASSSTPKGEVACLVDPFAGRGEAIAALVDALPGAGGYSGGHRVVTAELEDERSKVCVERTRYRYGGRWTHHHGDAFHLELDVGDEDGATVLYLNPPYDTDADFGRLEERALVRFTDALAPGGLLLYLIPRTAIAASAETLAKRYEHLRWYRLPDGEYEAFSQVLCLATKRYHDLDASPEADTIRALAKETADLPPLEEGLLLHVPTRKRAGFDRVSMHALDAEVLKMYRPWFQTARGRADSTVQTVFPAPGTPMAARAFKSAVPPRPSHIAYAMASGVFNGARVAPNEAFQGLPELLVKGQFARKYKVKEEVFNADGELKGTVQVQQPELTITALRLDTHALVTLVPTAETSSTPSVTEGFTIGDLFTRYGDGLLGALLAQCKVQYNPQHDNFDIPEMDRPLFAAQKHTVRALTALLGGPNVPMAKRVGTAGILLGELGCGKTSVALGVQRALGRVPMLVMCPPHLLESWRIEAAKVAKDVEVQFLRTPQDVDRFCESKGPVLGVMSREGAKLGSHVVGVQGGCPRCGAALPPGDLAARRARCKAPIRAPQNAEARVFDAMLREGYAWLSDANMTVAAEYMGASHARLARVARRYRVTSDTPDAASELRKAERKRLRRHLRRADLRAMLAEALWSAFDRGDYGLKGARRNRVSAASLAQSVFFAVNDPAWARAVLRELYDRAKGSDSAHVRSTIRDLVFWCTKSPEDAADFDVWAKVAWKPSYGTVASAKSAWEGLKSPNGGPLSWEGYRLTPEGKLGRVRDGAMVTVGSAAAATTMLDALRTRGLWGDSTPCGEPLYQASPEPEGSKTRGAKHADATGGLRRIPLATYLSRKCPRDFQFLLVMDECFVAGTMVSGRPIETLRVGDVVDSWDESARLVVPRRVKRLFVSRPSALVRVRFGNGAEFVCTPGHPVLTARGWVPAGALHPGDSVRCTSRGQNETPVERALCLVPGRGRACRHGHLTRSEQRPEGARGVLLPAVQEGPHGGSCFRATTSVRGEFSQETQGVGGSLPGLRHPNDSLWARGGVCAQGGLRVLFPSLHGAGDGRCDWSGDGHHHQTERTVLLRTHEGEQPDARPRGASEGRSYASGEGLETTYAGGERPSPTCPAATIGRRFGVADGGGSTHGDPGVSTLSLQAGHREYHLEGVYRGGRRGARCPDGTSGGCAQADVPGGTWVVCVEVLEPGGDGRFGGVCPDGLVYNLEVEGTHTYTAAGVVVHNCHELSTVGSAQEKAAHRLTALRRPTLLLTGSWMNGYADSLFSHQWALFQDFREEFPRTARTSFVDRYGFREKYVPVSSKPVVSERGAVSDRELKDQEKDRGVAPGVMPDFLLRHLLPHCVTLQRSDFAEELPGCTEESVPLHAGDELHAEHVGFMRKLLETIKGDRFNADLAGALFGQLNEAPSQLDRCTLDTGNTPSGDFVMRYPVRVREKFPTLDVVSATKGRPTSFLHPKEVWLLERLARERAEGRRTMVMGWHTEIFERYARLIERAFGERPPILYADKVPAAKRLEWIQKRVVDAGATELIVNPATVGTGLNNLVHFATGVFLENPACNPQIARQVKGRLDRIGQNLPVRFFWPHYAKTGQAVMLELLQRKSAIAMSVDGLDASTALQAVGVGEGYLTSISVSKALYDALIGDAYA